MMSHDHTNLGSGRLPEMGMQPHTGSTSCDLQRQAGDAARSVLSFSVLLLHAVHPSSPPASAALFFSPRLCHFTERGLRPGSWFFVDGAREINHNNCIIVSSADVESLGSKKEAEERKEGTE